MSARLLLKNDVGAHQIVTDIARLEDDAGVNGVRCPVCEWRPRPSSRWCCVWSEGPEPFFESCRTVWNTFTTHGRCPGCGHQWQWTSCLRCGEWSPHEDWYEEKRD